MVRVIMLLVMGIFLAVPAMATTYYVSTAGNDVNPGTTESTPWRTVVKAVNTMVAGDTTYIRGGTYNEGVMRFRTPGTQSAQIKLLNYPGERPIIQCVNMATFDRMIIQHASGERFPMGWITIEGLEIRNCYDSLKIHNGHDLTIRKNVFFNGLHQGILGNGTRVLIEGNVIYHNGNTTGNQNHGIYFHGTNVKILNNVIYDNQHYGIQINGSSSSTYNTSVHAGPEFATAANWVIANNTIAYNQNRAGIVIWGTQVTNLRVENNIFYENGVSLASSAAQAIDFCCSATSGSTGIQIKNNHSYASGSGAQQFLGSNSVGSQFTQSGNVVNISPPAFVNGGANALPASADFRLTASAPVNIAIANEFPNNSTNVVGAFKTVATPTASITTNIITMEFSMAANTPISNLSTAGLTVSCVGSACPVSPSVGSVVRLVGSDTIVRIVVNGISGNACQSANQTWSISYNGGTGVWSAFDDIGPFPGLHQKIFTFTGIPVTNLCSGSAPPPPPTGGGLHIKYNANEGSGATLNDSSGNSVHGTLFGGATWGPGHSGTGVVLTRQSVQYVAVPWGSGVDPTAQSLTIAFGVLVDAANVSLAHTYMGSSLGVNQRLYVSTHAGTWRLGIQGSNDAVASDLAVTAGWNFIIVRLDKDTPGSGTGTATLCVNRVCSNSPGAKKTYTSYALASNIEWGRLAGTANGPGGTFDDFSVYLNAIVDTNQLYDEFVGAAAPPPGGNGVLEQDAVQVQALYLSEVGDAPVNLRPLNQPKQVAEGGALVWLFQVRCTSTGDCGTNGFRLSYRKNGVGAWQQVPNFFTESGIAMWAAAAPAPINAGSRTARLDGSCPVVTGSTYVNISQSASINLLAGQCVTLAWIVRYGNVAGAYFEHRVERSGGDALSAYAVLARADVRRKWAGF